MALKYRELDFEALQDFNEDSLKMDRANSALAHQLYKFEKKMQNKKRKGSAYSSHSRSSNEMSEVESESLGTNENAQWDEMTTSYICWSNQYFK